MRDIFVMECELANIKLMYNVLTVAEFEAARSPTQIHVTPTESTGHLPAKMRGDRTRLTQVLVNLVRNAIKFTVRGTVRILAAYDSARKTLLVHVQDNGLGISAEDQERIFKIDTVLTGSRSLNRDGLGMGLHICQTTVAKFGGSISVESPGHKKGSTFTFSMQMKEATGGEPALGMIQEDVIELELDDPPEPRQRSPAIVPDEGRLVRNSGDLEAQLRRASAAEAPTERQNSLQVNLHGVVSDAVSSPFSQVEIDDDAEERKSATAGSVE